MPEIIWLKARCPICKDTYEYPEGGYKLPTCNRFECLHAYLHPEIKRGSIYNGTGDKNNR